MGDQADYLIDRMSDPEPDLRSRPRISDEERKRRLAAHAERALSAKHQISYFGGKKSGYGWECSCGDGSSRVSLQVHGKIVPWESAFDRTCESHDHLEAVGLPIPRFRS